MKPQSVACKSSWTTWPKGMRDVIRWKHAALLALAILAAGCSSNSKKELPPAELTDFKEEVVLQKQWSRSIGDGQGAVGRPGIADDHFAHHPAHCRRDQAVETARQQALGIDGGDDD